jgi:hypothetical protein
MAQPTIPVSAPTELIVGNTYRNGRFGLRYILQYLTPEQKAIPQLERWCCFRSISDPDKWITIPIQLAETLFFPAVGVAPSVPATELPDNMTRFVAPTPDFVSNRPEDMTRAVDDSPVESLTVPPEAEPEIEAVPEADFTPAKPKKSKKA